MFFTPAGVTPECSEPLVDHVRWPEGRFRVSVGENIFPRASLRGLNRLSRSATVERSTHKERCPDRDMHPARGSFSASAL
jgi:hypothetical protein